MYVVFVGIGSFEDDFRVVVLDFFDTRCNEGLNAFVDDTASVFGRKHYMVVTEEYTVGFMTIERWHYLLMIVGAGRKRQTS